MTQVSKTTIHAITYETSPRISRFPRGPSAKCKLRLLDNGAAGATGSRSTCAGAAIEEASTAHGGGSRSEAAAAAGRPATRTSQGRATVAALSGPIRKPFLGEYLAMLDIDQGLSPVACPAVAGAG
jgi:hypothetical protein